MAKNKEKEPMGIDDNILVLPIGIETVPPQKGKTEAQKPKETLELLQDGDEYISIKVEETKSKEQNQH